MDKEWFWQQEVVGHLASIWGCLEEIHTTLKEINAKMENGDATRTQTQADGVEADHEQAQAHEADD